jgi:hypothetical protein
MKEYYRGLDVHKDSVLMAVLDDRKVRISGKADSEVAGTWEVGTNSPQPVKAIKRYSRSTQKHLTPIIVNCGLK